MPRAARLAAALAAAALAAVLDAAPARAQGGARRAAPRDTAPAAPAAPAAPRADWMLGPFVKPATGNPVVAPDPASRFRSPMQDSVVAWEAFATFNPAAVVRGGRVHLLYRAEDSTGAAVIGGHTSRLGLAASDDGVHFVRRPAPVLYPDRDLQARYEWPGGVEDPRVVEAPDGTYVLTYTQWNRDVPRLAVATSRDLVRWTKHGPAFADAAGGQYLRARRSRGRSSCAARGTGSSRRA
jgi:predicted GH43/DUF377 family glycosyl hydrolase